MKKKKRWIAKEYAKSICEIRYYLYKNKPVNIGDNREWFAVEDSKGEYYIAMFYKRGILCTANSIQSAAKGLRVGQCKEVEI